MNESQLSIFTKIPTLVTDRLIMRKMLISDYSDMFDYASRPITTKYLLWSPHESPKFTKKYLSYLQGQYREENFYDFALVEKDSGKMIGTCGFTRFNFSSYSAEIGFVLNPKYWGYSIAPEASRRVIRFGFDTLELHRIEARYMENNIQSRRVMEKSGMTFEGIYRDMMLVRGQFVSVGVCSILRSEFNRNRIMSQLL